MVVNWLCECVDVLVLCGVFEVKNVCEIVEVSDIVMVCVDILVLVESWMYGLDGVIVGF